MANQSIFVISLDFELHWGRFDKADPLGTKKYYRNTQKIIPKILSYLEKHQVEATWAAVGMLLAQNKKEWKLYAPKLKPSYNNSLLSAYDWYEKRRIYKKSLFAPDLAAKIIETAGQELGSHTFAHYYTMEEGQTLEEFTADLEAAKKITSGKFNIQPTALVFPRNQCNPSYMKVCKNMGFKVVRSNPANWFWQNTHKESLIKRIFRTADTFFPAGRRTSFPLSDIKVQEDMPIQIPSSRLLRSINPKNKVFRELRLKRIKHEMSLAAKKGEVYHLWWHPHNFGEHPKQNLSDLKEILEHFSKLKDTYGMISKNMSGVADMIESRG
jgi:peptidoglycan/xylan/chitin deacetylase (PgdA/CDA1 family)